MQMHADTCLPLGTCQHIHIHAKLRIQANTCRAMCVKFRFLMDKHSVCCVYLIAPESVHCGLRYFDHVQLLMCHAHLSIRENECKYMSSLSDMLNHTQPSDMWRHMKIHAQPMIQVSTRRYTITSQYRWTHTDHAQLRTHAVAYRRAQLLMCQHMWIHPQLLICAYTCLHMPSPPCMKIHTKPLWYMQTHADTRKSPEMRKHMRIHCPALDTCLHIMCWNMPCPQSMKIHNKPLINASRAALNKNQHMQDLNKHTHLQTR
jgi:hypothetical protein